MDLFELAALIRFNGGNNSGGLGVRPLNVTENGTYTAQSGRGFTPVTVAVPVPVLDELSVEENGTYTAEDGHAYSKVVVDTPAGGKILTLLGSGSYTKTNYALDQTSVTIPVSFSGIPAQILVYAQPASDGVSQTLKWAGQFDLTDGISAQGFSTLVDARYHNAANEEGRQWAHLGFAANGTTLYCQQISNSYPVRNNTYYWYIWGYEEQ